MAKLYLIPNVLGDSPWEAVLPAQVQTICKEIRYFIVENIRTARRFLKMLDPGINIDSLTFFELNKFTSEEEKLQFIRPLLEGENTGVISEAGCPGVADPGADIVLLAHRNNIQVAPLVGPSSVLLALMASGFNGQNFTFNGYLPVKPDERKKQIRFLEKKSQAEKQTQIFIETPYRNNQMLADLVRSCAPQTLLCIACNLTSGDEFISTRSVSQWGKNLPDLNKKPAIFLLFSV